MQTRVSDIVAKNMVVLEWRPTGAICLKISPALIGVWIVSQGLTDFLQLGYVPSLLIAT